MVQARLGLAEPPRPADAADAAALALCHLAVAPVAGRRVGGGAPMIGSLRGTRARARRRRPRCSLEVARRRLPGHGHARARWPSSTLGAEAFLHVHHHIREDAQTLYGFATRDERACFEALLGAHGVGPGPRPGHPRRPRARASCAGVVADDDVDALCLVPGVGKKTAARLLLELKGRLDGRRPRRPRADRQRHAGRSTADPGRARGPRRPRATATDEIRDALRELPGGGDAVDAAARRPEGAGGPACVTSSSTPAADARTS